VQGQRSCEEESQAETHLVEECKKEPSEDGSQTETSPEIKKSFFDFEEE